MIVDSNIVIYTGKAEFPHLRKLIAEHAPAVSAISYLEVLGYHQMTPDAEQDLTKIFETLQVIPISQPILEQVVKLRQQRKMSVGDAIIAATA
ncbi:MAG: type II toxin-antitoxin system VapC family toxin, partial [Chloroflexota bacterium]